MTLKYKKDTVKDFIYEYCGAEYVTENDLIYHSKAHPKKTRDMKLEKNKHKSVVFNLE